MAALPKNVDRLPAPMTARRKASAPDNAVAESPSPARTARKSAAKPAGPDRSWHLATDATETALVDLEFALIRTYQSFLRWQSECINAVTHEPISGDENALLHVVRMRGSPKEMKDLIRITNRQDVANIQYGLRKLLKMGLIEKTGSGRAGVFYQATDKGIRVCDEYARLRRDVLLDTVRKLSRFADLSGAAEGQLVELERAYETASRDIASFHRGTDFLK